VARHWRSDKCIASIRKGAFPRSSGVHRHFSWAINAQRMASIDAAVHGEQHEHDEGHFNAESRAPVHHSIHIAKGNGIDRRLINSRHRNKSCGKNIDLRPGSSCNVRGWPLPSCFASPSINYYNLRWMIRKGPTWLFDDQGKRTSVQGRCLQLVILATHPVTHTQRLPLQFG
jgi:hypothetical protein